ncbi:MAG: extracellular solute-binding protein [Candidimonas sp.]|jgi:putative spermidine/putrescine transport system substrate-binding protein
MKITRRNVLLAGAAGAACAGMGRLAWAQQGGRVVVGTWGGDYGSLLRENVDTAFSQASGIDVVQDIGTPDPRKTKILAERQGRRASMDVAFFNDTDAFLLGQQDLLTPIDANNVPRMAEVVPQLRKAYSIPHIYSFQVILYNPAKIDPAPTSFADFWNPKWRGHIGFVDDMYRQVTIAAALAGGGSITRFDPAWDKLLELRELGAKVYSSNEALASAIKSEEIWMTTLYLSRGYMWKQGGLPLEHVVASEGAPIVAFEAVVPKNSRNQEGALGYLNAVLGAQAQAAFAKKMGYLPTVQDAVLPPEIAKSISLSAEQQQRLLVPDYDYSARMNPQVLDFWTKQFKG